MPNVIRDELARLRRVREVFSAEDWTPPDESEHLRPWWPGRIEMLPDTAAPLAIPELLVGVRAGIEQFAEDHMEKPIDKEMAMLLMKVPPGTGKTRIAVEACQRKARVGQRILFCGARHNHFRTIGDFPHFDGALWYEWLPIHENRGEGDRIPTTCRYAKWQDVWLRKGYRSMDLCMRVCVHDQWLRQCPFRQQRKRNEPIIYAMHQHLVHGIALKGFDLAVVDEMPLGAFVKERHIPVAGLRINCVDPLRSLLNTIEQIARGAAPKVVIRERPLLEQIGPILEGVYEEMMYRDDMLPLVPNVRTASEVAYQPYWFVPDLLRLLMAEYEAWKHAWPHWVSRVAVSNQGMIMLDRASVWKDLPRRLLALDATGKPELYQQIFGQSVEVYAPRVERPGRIYQIAGRLNGAGTVLEDIDDNGNGVEEGRRLSKQGREMLDLARRIAGQYHGRVGVVTFKAAENEFAQVFGAGNVRHFGDLRGSNDMEDVEALIVAGGYAPRIGTVLEMAAAIYPDRIKPFGAEDEKGRLRPVYSIRRCAYRLTEEAPRPPGVPAHYTAWREQKGYWGDPELSAIHEQLREAEIVQAIHRARPNLQPCDVWVLTSIPTEEILDGIWDDPPAQATGSPDGIPWRTWEKIEPWLAARHAGGEIVTAETLAAFLGIGADWPRKQRWLAAIARSLPCWTIGAIRPNGRHGGRPTVSLCPR